MSSKNLIGTHSVQIQNKKYSAGENLKQVFHYAKLPKNNFLKILIELLLTKTSATN